VMLQPIVMNSTPASVLCSSMKAFPLVLIVIAVLSASGKGASIQVSVTVLQCYSTVNRFKQISFVLKTIFSASDIR
jgi:hypothetical protein